MLILHVTYTPIEGKSQAFLERIEAEGIGAASRAEDGNIDYSYFRYTDGSEMIRLIEIWKDEAALEAHKQMPHFKHLATFKDEYIASTDVKIYTAELK